MSFVPSGQALRLSCMTDRIFLSPKMHPEALKLFGFPTPSVSVEGELGYLNEETGQGPVGNEDTHTQVRDVAAYTAASGVDAVAIAIGNAHGIYKGTPKLDFRRLADIAQAVTTPLVLHGSSGIPKEDLQKAIRLGIRKVNINTEVSTAGVKAARAFLAEHMNENTRFEEVTKAAEQTMTKVVASYLPWLDLSE